MKRSSEISAAMPASGLRAFGRSLARTATGAIAVLALAAVPALADTISLSPGASDTIERRGMAGGATDSGDCGFVADAPNHRLSLAQDMSALSVQVRGSNSMTLLVEGPGGRFCIPVTDGIAKLPGYWTAGTHDLYIGDRSGNGGTYTLSIEAQ